MKQIAILTGGPSAEREVALRSANLVHTHLDRTRYEPTTILIEENGWFEAESGKQVDLNRFALGDIQFDFAFLMVHGTPVEDGKLQGYFESMGIPHSTCDTLTCALTFNKQWCKDMLSKYDIPMAASQVVFADEINDVDSNHLDYPVFVKPNKNGSSFGVTKVHAAKDLSAALAHAAKFDDEIMIEAFMAGREFGCGVVKEGKVLHAFPVTELISENEFFDYEAKYEGASEEVTPADITPEQSTACRNLSKRLYRILNCKGMVRFDFILVGDTFNLLEANTVPGMSAASIIPQQAVAYGWTIPQLLETVIVDAMSST